MLKTSNISCEIHQQYKGLMSAPEEPRPRLLYAVRVSTKKAFSQSVSARQAHPLDKVDVPPGLSRMFSIQSVPTQSPKFPPVGRAHLSGYPSELRGHI